MFYVENEEIKLSVHPVVQLLTTIKLSIADSIINFDAIDENLDSLKNYFLSDIAYRLMGSVNDGQAILENVLKRAIGLKLKATIKNCLLTFNNFLTGQPDVVNDGFLHDLVDLIKSDSLGKHCNAMVFRIFYHCCVKHEANKQILINEPNCIIPLAVNQLETHGSKSRELTKDVCSFLRSLILDDDIRVAFGRGTENAKSIVTETNCLDVISRLCKG